MAARCGAALDPVHQPNVGFPVHPLAARAPRGRRQQANLLVVAKRPHCQAGPAGDIVDPEQLVIPLLVAAVHIPDVRTFRGGRFKTFRGSAATRQSARR
jgi:hypothetical protein